MSEARAPAAAGNAQLALWQSDFGRRYTDRNQIVPRRDTAWERMIGQLPVRRILEVGCNVGWNLNYLSAIGDYDLYGIEPQEYAVRRARVARPQHAILSGDAFDIPFRDQFFDLVFTAGVLIHINPGALGQALDELYRVSGRYLLYIEYDSEEETAVHYRGQTQALWRRDHARAWCERYPDLRELDGGYWSRADGFDDCTWRLFEKGGLK